MKKLILQNESIITQQKPSVFYATIITCLKITSAFYFTFNFIIKLKGLEFVRPLNHFTHYCVACLMTF